MSDALVRLRGTARRIGAGDGPLAGTCQLTVGEDERRVVTDGTFELVGETTAIVEVAGAARGSPMAT